MITVRQIERLWTAKSYKKLFEQLMSPRPEGSEFLLKQFTGQASVAAGLAVIRLDELTQPFAPVYGELVRSILKAQLPDGGWGDVMTTAMCVRALLCGNGDGEAIGQGLANLATLQKPEGIWPNIPNMRMPVDAFASAFVLLRLGDVPQFHGVVDVKSAIDWFEVNEMGLDADTRRLWTHAKRRLPAVVDHLPRNTATKSSGGTTFGFWDFVPALSA